MESSSSGSGHHDLSASSGSSPAALLSVFELSLHLSAFKNIDLFRQGLYYLRAAFYTEQTEEATGRRSVHTRAMPYHLLEPPPSASPASGSSSSLPPVGFHARHVSSTYGEPVLPQPVFAAFIDDSLCSFSSSTFRVQYCEQVVHLQDGCLFRIELSSRHRLPLVLTVELMYSEYTQQDVLRGREPPPPAAFERVSSRSYQLSALYTGGVHSFLPLVFDENHFCQCDAAVHSCMTEFRFRLGQGEHSISVGSGSGLREDGRGDENGTSKATENGHDSGNATSSRLVVSVSHQTSAPNHSAAPSLSSLPSSTASPPSPSLSSARPSGSSTATSASANEPPSAASASSSDSEVRPPYPPFALVLFPRLLSPPLSSVSASAASTVASASASVPAGAAPAAPLYTAKELSSLADRYHLFFVSNLIRSYNHLAICLERYVRCCMGEEEREELQRRGITVQPLTLPEQMLKRKERGESRDKDGSEEERKSDDRGDDSALRSRAVAELEEKKEHSSHLRPTAIDTSAIQQSGQRRRPSSPSSPSILNISPPHASNGIVVASGSPSLASSAAVSPPVSPLPSPVTLPESTASSLTFLPSPLPSSADETGSSSSRRPVRRRHSSDRRTAAELSDERREQAAIAALHAKYRTPRLERLSHRLRRSGRLSYDGIVRAIVSDLQNLSQQSFALWSALLSALPLAGVRLFEYGRREWELQCLEQWSGFVFRESYSAEHRSKVADDDMIDTHQQVAAVARKNAPLLIPPLAIRELDTTSSPLSGAAGGAASASAAAAAEVRDRGGLMGDYDNMVVVFEEAYSRRERGRQQDDDGGGDGADVGAEAEGGQLAVDVDSIDLQPKEIEDVDIDHSAVVITGVDSREVPAVLLQASAASSSQPSSPRDLARPHALTVGAPAVTSSLGVVSALLQPHSASTASAGGGGAEQRSSMSRSGSHPTLSLPSIPSSLPDSSSFSSTSSTSSSSPAPALHKLSNSTGRHVWVLCHGYQGNSWDLRSFKNQLSLLFPEALVLLSAANESHTEDDIGLMGQRLALEVSALVNDHCPDSLGRLSFVGHSLGGLIIRSALTHPVLQPFLPYAHSLITCASPHLGYLYAVNPFLTTGLWFLKKCPQQSSRATAAPRPA